MSGTDDNAADRPVLATTFMQDSVRVSQREGPVFQRTLFNLDFTFVSGVDLVAELADEQRFVKHVYPNLASLRPMVGDGLLTAETDDPHWQTAHGVLASGFTQQAMRRHHPRMVAVVDDLTRAWDRAVNAGPVDVTDDMTRTALEIIAAAGFGQSLGAFRLNQSHPFVRALTETILHCIRRVTLPPDIGVLLGRRDEHRYAENVSRLNAIVDDIIAARHDTEEADLLAHMLSARSLDRRAIRHQIITFLAAGYETTAGALAFTLYALATHPDVLARARDEVDEVWGEQSPQYEQVAGLRYLRRVIDESLRLWPSAPGYARRARTDTILGGKYPMRAGDAMFVLIPALHRDPVWGRDVDRFDPDRFLRDRVAARPAHAYKPFGSGVRACIGRQFALHQIALVIGTLIRRYEMRSDPAYRLRIQEALTMRPAGFALDLALRKESADDRRRSLP
ncbi:MAG: hypothetical protein QOH97_5021 [Actinoplanes sp.]|nr:hypothetical protein [Actinoplanes sp.]